MQSQQTPFRLQGSYVHVHTFRFFSFLHSIGPSIKRFINGASALIRIYRLRQSEREKHGKDEITGLKTLFACRVQCEAGKKIKGMIISSDRRPDTIPLSGERSVPACLRTADSVRILP